MLTQSIQCHANDVADFLVAETDHATGAIDLNSQSYSDRTESTFIWGAWNLTLQVTSVHQYQCTGKEIHTGTSRLAGVHSGRVSLLDTGPIPIVNVALSLQLREQTARRQTLLCKITSVQQLLPSG